MKLAIASTEFKLFKEERIIVNGEGVEDVKVRLDKVSIQNGSKSQPKKRIQKKKKH